ncbi:MAG: EAL domain-containing protein [Rhodocyclales bacterium]|nr:EAL domain-containing protein [Rhodocyclales bacterium]
MDSFSAHMSFGSRISRLIRQSPLGPVLAAAAVVLLFSAMPIYFAVGYGQDQQRQFAAEAERHLSSRLGHAETLLDRAKTIPGIVAMSIAQAGSPVRFEGTVRNLLAMSGIVDSIHIASVQGPATVIHRDPRDQQGRVDVRFGPSATLALAHEPVIDFGERSLQIRESLAEVDARGNSRFWGYVTAHASFAYLIDEMQLRTLVRDGFGVNLGIRLQSATTETAIFNGGKLDAAVMSRTLALPGGAALILSVAPPAASFAGLHLLAGFGLLAVDVILFLLTFHLLRRPQFLERQVEARTQEIVAEKAALKKEIAARAKAESYLERSHALLDSIFEHIPGMIVLRRISDMRIARINSSGERMLGRSRDFLTGRSNEEIYAPEFADFLAQGDRQALGEPGLVALPVRRVDMPAAASRWIGFSKTALRDRAGVPQYILEFGEDLTERVDAERHVARLNRVLSVLRDINRLIIHARDEQGLLAEARRILQEQGEFSAVWIHRGSGSQVQLIADASMHDFAGRIREEIDNPQRRCWPERNLHCQALECCNRELARELQQHGLQSLVHLPLRSGEVVWGDIGILGAVGQSFSAEERALLEELAGNLSFALDAMHQDQRRRAAEYKLELSARVFEHNSEGIMITDDANRILMVNRAFTALTGYSAAEVIGKTPALLNSGRHAAEFFEQMWRTLEQEGEWRGEIINRRKNGEEFPEWLTLSLVRSDDGKVTNYVAVFSDLTARRKIEARLDFLSHYDALTALPNRDHFGARLALTLAAAKEDEKRVAVIYFDLDRFKLINETVGHVAGDHLLVEVSSRLAAEAKSKLDVARLGGDQFAIVIPGLDSAAQATQHVMRLQEKLCQPFLRGSDQEIHISGSIGISVFPEDGDDAETLTRNADSAMYQAIADGGNTYRFFRQEMNERAAERVEIESRLHHALEQGELTVHFQPFVKAASGRIVGAEALLRWFCPELGGNVSPATFIPLLEDTGLIRPVGEWVLHQACAEVRRWRARSDRELFVAVNISALQLNSELPQLVAAAIAEHGIAPQQLEIELTESAVMRDADTGIRILHELQALGVQLSIDDFGTGYSSLSYLKRLPMSTLKIDRSFVLDTPDDAEAVSITRAILALGHALHLNIIAEGVETSEQVAFLCENGCDLLQGHFFSKALPAADFRRLLAENPVFAATAVTPRPLQLLSGKRLHA